MVRLKDLLFEGAAEDAHKQGLKALPYGNWEKNGRTVDDKLVPVNSDNASPRQQNTAADVDKMPTKPKPTGMSAKDAGTAPSNIPTKKDHDKKSGAAANAGEQQLPNSVLPNPYFPRPITATRGRPLTPQEAKEVLPKEKDKFDLTDDLIVGEQIVEFSGGDYMDFICAFDDVDPGIEGKEDALRQHDTFRKTLDPQVQEELASIQSIWQTDPQYDAPKETREQMNTIFNTLGNTHKPMAHVTEPLERGMAIKGEDLKDFLSTFRIGELVDFPPSGFSIRPKVARGFMAGNPNSVSVLIRLAPDKNGQVHGIHLSNMEERPKDPSTYQVPKSKLDYELEVVRYSGPKAKCVNATKILCPGNGMAMYVLDLEEQGYEQESMYEGMDDQKPNPTLDYYMNSSVSQSPQDAYSNHMTEIFYIYKRILTGN